MNQKLMDDLSIDCVIFGFQESLKVLLVKHAEGISKDRWALPGGFIQANESVNSSASRILYALTGIKDLFLEQLGAFGEVDRFPGKRVVTIAYYALLADTAFPLQAGFTASDAKWFDPVEILGLPYDHEVILKSAIEKLRARVKQEPIGFNLLPEKFSLHQLQLMFESILNITFDKPNFRRKILNTGLLKAWDERLEGSSHRAPKLYSFDEVAYQNMKEKQFILNW